MKNFKLILTILIVQFMLISLVYGQSSTETTKIEMDFKEYDKALETINTNIATIEKLVESLKNQSITEDAKTLLMGIKTTLDNLQGEIDRSTAALKQSGNDLLNTSSKKIKDDYETRISELNTKIDLLKSSELSKFFEKMKEEAKQKSNLENDIKLKEAELKTSNESLNTEKARSDKLTEEIKYQKEIIGYLDGGALNFGLAVGFNGVLSGRDVSYTVDSNSKAREVFGASLKGMISAVLCFQLNKIDLILNVPLIEIGLGGGDADSVTNIFNKSIDVGIGIGVRLSSKLSVGFILNVSGQKIIDDLTLEEIEFSEPKNTRIDTSKYYTTTKAGISLTVGLIMKLGKGKPKENQGSKK